jgi:hypothetical protein
VTAARDSLIDLVDATRTACASAFRTLGLGAPPDDRDRRAMAGLARELGASGPQAAQVLDRLGADGDDRLRAARRTMIGAAWSSLDHLAAAPLAPSVKTLACLVFRSLCDESTRDGFRFRPDLYEESRALAACAAFSRFPAGQLDWEVSGLPRSYLFRVPLRDLPRVIRTLLFRLGGFHPCFTPHMGVRRYPLLFLEAENNLSYYRMAASMALQPAVKGLVMSAWYHSPETIRVSPHLSWTNRTPLQHGAILTEIGAASPSDGFLTGSQVRRELFERRAYRPTLGLVIWPRRDLLAWAKAHPELDAATGTG